MKKKSSYILAGLAIIPIVSALVITSLAKRNTYYLANEKGNRKEMGNVNLEILQSEGNSYVFNRKVTITADDIKTEKDSSFDLYGSHKGIKDNKDLFRGKTISQQFIAESDKYACYASVEQKSTQYFIDLYIKDLKSGDIKNKQYNLNFDSSQGYFNTCLVKISGGFVNVVLQRALSTQESSEQTATLINYKFDLVTGKFLKEFEIGKRLLVANGDTNNKNIYCYEYDNDKDNDGKLIIYNVINDTTEKCKLPQGFDIDTVIENNGSQYIFNSRGEMIERTSDGKLKDKVKFMEKKDNENSSINQLKVNDNKIYAIYSKYDGHGQKCQQESIKVFDIDNGKELYSGDIMKKGFFDSKGQAAGGYVHK